MADMRAIVYKDKDGRYRLDYTDANGRRKRERLPLGVTKMEANALLTHKVSELTKAKISGVSSLEALKPKTFHEFVTEEYLPSCQVRHTETTYRGDKSLASLLEGHFGPMPLRSITIADVERFAEKEARRELSEERKVRPATVNRKLMFLSAVFRAAIKRGYVSQNPVKGAAKLKEDNFKLRYFSYDEEQRFFKFLPVWLRPIVTFALNTGARLGEVLRLTWADLDSTQELIRITKTKSHKDRWIPANKTVMKLLESIKPEAETWEESPYVFGNPETKKPWHTNYVSHAFEKAVQSASIHDASFHTLRHTAASRMVQQGIHLNTVREILGHGSMTVTLRYAHLAPNNLRAAVDTLAQPPVQRKAGVKFGTQLAQKSKAKHGITQLVGNQ